MATTNTPLDWPQYYTNVLTGRPLPGLDGYDELSDSYFEEPMSLSDLIPENEINFIIIPSPRKKVVCFHSNAMIDDRIIGIFGTRRASPLYEFDLADATRAMMIPPATRNKKNAVMIPGIEDFEKLLDIGTPLSSIVGTSTIPVTDLGRWPSSLWVHPAIFTDCLGSTRETKADTAAHSVAALIDTIPERKGEALKLLIFLWAVEKGFTKAVRTRVPPDIPEVNDRALLLDARFANEEKSVSKTRDDTHSGSEDPPRSKKTKRRTPRTPDAENSDGDFPGDDSVGFSARTKTRGKGNKQSTSDQSRSKRKSKRKKSSRSGRFSDESDDERSRSPSSSSSRDNSSSTSISIGRVENFRINRKSVHFRSPRRNGRRPSPSRRPKKQRRDPALRPRPVRLLPTNLPPTNRVPTRILIPDGGNERQDANTRNRKEGRKRRVRPL
jgi:hypothetical protein